MLVEFIRMANENLSLEHGMMQMLPSFGGKIGS